MIVQPHEINSIIVIMINCEANFIIDEIKVINKISSPSYKYHKLLINSKQFPSKSNNNEILIDKNT